MLPLGISMSEVISILDKLYLWQVTMVSSIAMLILGFTGQGVTGFEIIEGKENLAIMAGMGFMAVSILLRYLPPPNRRRQENGRPKVAISAQQMALCSGISDWTDFDDAAQAIIPDHKLTLKALQVKSVELRLELGTLQGLLMRRISVDGHHQLKYRYDDATTFVGEDTTERGRR